MEAPAWYNSLVANGLTPVGLQPHKYKGYPVILPTQQCIYILPNAVNANLAPIMQPVRADDCESVQSCETDSLSVQSDSLSARSFESIAVDFAEDEYDMGPYDSIEPPPGFDFTFLDFVDEPPAKAPCRTNAPHTENTRAVRRVHHDARQKRNERKADYREQRRNFVPVDHFGDIFFHATLQ